MAGLDYELYHNLSIRVFYEDATGASGFKVVEVRLNDLNDQPLSFDAPGTPFTTFDLPEQSNIAGTPFLLGDITVNDPDGAPNGYGYRLSGADAAMFRVIDGKLYLAANAILDHETNPQLDVR